MKYMRYSAWALLFAVSTVAQAASGNARPEASATTSKQTSTGSAQPQSANTANTARATTAVQTYPTYNYQHPVQRSTDSAPQVVQSTNSSSSQYKFTEVAPRSLW